MIRKFRWFVRCMFLLSILSSSAPYILNTLDTIRPVVEEYVEEKMETILQSIKIPVSENAPG